MRSIGEKTTLNPIRQSYHVHLSELIATAKISPTPTAPRLETSEFRISPYCPYWNCQNVEERCVRVSVPQLIVVSFTYRIHGDREPTPTPNSKVEMNANQTLSNSKVTYHPCSAHLDGHDRFLPHDDQTSYPPAAQYAQIRPCRQEEGALPGGDQGWTGQIKPRTTITIPFTPVFAICDLYDGMALLGGEKCYC